MIQTRPTDMTSSRPCDMAKARLGTTHQDQDQDHWMNPTRRIDVITALDIQYKTLPTKTIVGLYWVLGFDTMYLLFVSLCTIIFLCFDMYWRWHEIQFFSRKQTFMLLSVSIDLWRKNIGYWSLSRMLSSFCVSEVLEKEIFLYFFLHLRGSSLFFLNQRDMYLALQSCVCGCKLILEIEKKIEALRLWIFSDFLCPPFFPQGGRLKRRAQFFKGPWFDSWSFQYFDVHFFW